MPKKAKAVFVYGTLKEGGHYSYYFDECRTSSRKAVIDGCLYKGLPFPFVVIDRPGEVHGEVHEYDDFDKILKLIDNIEGFVSEGYDGNLYERAVVEATLENGDKVDVYVYHMLFDKAMMYVQPWMKLERVKNGIWEI